MLKATSPPIERRRLQSFLERTLSLTHQLFFALPACLASPPWHNLTSCEISIRLLCSEKPCEPQVSGSPLGTSRVHLHSFSTRWMNPDSGPEGVWAIGTETGVRPGPVLKVATVQRWGGTLLWDGSSTGLSGRGDPKAVP